MSYNLKVPSHAEVLVAKATNLVSAASALRGYIIAALSLGRTSVEGMYSDVIVDLIADEFLEAGWVIENEGLSLNLRQRRSTDTRIEPS